jgi:hypothetical protein
MKFLQERYGHEFHELKMVIILTYKRAIKCLCIKE